METLEELKAIIAGKPDDAQSVMMVCNPIYTKLESGFWYAACKGQDWLQVTDKQIGNMRSLSDIERIIELEEKINDFANDINDCNCLGAVAKTLRQYGL